MLKPILTCSCRQKHTVKNLLNIDGAKLQTTDVLAVVIVMTLFAALVGIFTVRFLIFSFFDAIVKQSGD